MRNCLTYLIAVLFVAAALVASAQEKVPYYASLNNASVSAILDISDSSLHLQYHDYYGKWKEIPLEVYDFSRKPVAKFNLDKSYGLNSYSINLREHFNAWILGSIYIAELKDESGAKHELYFRLAKPPEYPNPTANILVNPIQVKCEATSQNVVEFYGEIKGGKAPYTVQWFVVNENRNDLLYQPRQERLNSEGKTIAITVDKSPDYYVILYVKDSCGKEAQQIVNLVCRENRKRISSIFVEDMDFQNLIKTGN